MAKLKERMKLNHAQITEFSNHQRQGTLDKFREKYGLDKDAYIINKAHTNLVMSGRIKHASDAEAYIKSVKAGR